ncbi:hypothetical protein F4677DRAFT_414435 [Hypoxylon crocopeplum]|nr:hypothetical protein F4677DRAFT_414435 [Hypoxylon crocopeplum]
MHKDLYIDSYLRYKSGTKRIFKWLVTAGRMCNAQVPLNDEQTSESRGTRRLPLSRYVELARSVANSTDPKIEVGPRLLSVLRDVVNLRKAFGLMYQQEASVDEDQDRRNKTHRHFVSLLEDILACLEPLKVHKVQADTATPDNDLPRNKPGSNLFDVLDVEDVEEPVAVGQDLVRATPEARANAKAKSKGKSKGKAADFEYDETIDPQSSNDEFYFVLFCFFKDLNDVRTYIRGAWTDYCDGKLPLVSAAVATDLAVNMVQRKEREFLEKEIIFGDKEVTVEQWINDQKKTHISSAVGMYWIGKNGRDGMESVYMGDLLFSFITNAVKTEPHTDKKNLDTFTLRRYDLANWLCIPEFVSLDIGRVLSRGVELPGIPIFVSEGGKLETVGFEHRMRFKEDFEVLVELFNCMLLVALTQDANMPGVDTWTDAMVEYAALSASADRKPRSKAAEQHWQEAPSTWLIWASAVVLDINRVLGPNIGRPFQELRTASYAMKRQLQRHFRWSRQWRDPGWPKSNDNSLRRVLTAIEHWVFEDKGSRMGDSILKGITSQPHWLMLHQPILCGVSLMWIRLNMWGAGLELTNVFTAVFSTTHLYNMASVESGKRIAWPDLDYVINLNGPEYLFIGGRPSKGAEYCNRWALALGISATSVSSGHRVSQIVSGRGFAGAVRQLRPSILLSNMLGEMYKTFQTKDPNKALIGDALELLVAWQGKRQSNALVRRDSQSSFIVPLIDMASKVVAEEYEHLLFDYFALHQRCWNLLVRFQSDLYDDWKLANAITGEDHLAKDQLTIRSNVGHIMEVSRTLAEVKEKNKGRTNAAAQRLGQILPHTYSVIENFARAQGSVGRDEVARLLESETIEEIGDGTEQNTSPNDNGMATFEDFLNDTHYAQSRSKALDNDTDVELMAQMSGLNAQATEVLKKATRMPLSEWPAGPRAMLEMLESQGADIGTTGFIGASETMYDMIRKLPDDKIDQFLATTKLDQVMEILKEANGISDSKKRRKNKNKNKNRALRRKAERQAAKEQEELKTQAEALTLD